MQNRNSTTFLEYNNFWRLCQGVSKFWKSQKEEFWGKMSVFHNFNNCHQKNAFLISKVPHYLLLNKHSLSCHFICHCGVATGNVRQSGPGLVAIIQMWHHSEGPDVTGNQIKLRPATARITAPVKHTKPE